MGAAEGRPHCWFFRGPIQYLYFLCIFNFRYKNTLPGSSAIRLHCIKSINLCAAIDNCSAFGRFHFNFYSLSVSRYYRLLIIWNYTPFCRVRPVDPRNFLDRTIRCILEGAIWNVSGFLWPNFNRGICRKKYFTHCVIYRRNNSNWNIQLLRIL